MVTLSYDVSADHTVVTGIESVVFRPDLPVCEVVFRAWPNKPDTSSAGNSMSIGRVLLNGHPLPTTEHAGGAPKGAPGTLVEATLPTCRAAGSELRLTVEFTVTLGAGTDERMGRDEGTRIAWLATAYPLLAWQRQVGWVRDDAQRLIGETSTSETFELASLEVTVGAHERVAAVGSRGPTRAREDGRVTHTFTAPAMRDVAVTVGEIEVRDVESGGIRVHVAVPRRTPEPQRAAWEELVTTSLLRLAELLGPVPYEDLWVSMLPGVTEGVEQSGAIQLALVDPAEDGWLVTHELAHQWFYGLVGNNQALHPWLDESVATYVQEVVAPIGWEVGRTAHAGELGRPMSYWAGQHRADDVYSASVYAYGASVLLELRDEVGAARMNAALRDYLRENAHQIAAPEDLRRALADLPGAERRLAAVGAW